MVQINLDTVVKRVERVASAELKDMTVMLSMDNGKYYGLDDIALRVWELMKNPVPVKAIISSLLGEFNVSPLQCERDVMVFLDQLSAENLIEVDHVG